MVLKQSGLFILKRNDILILNEYFLQAELEALANTTIIFVCECMYYSDIAEALQNFPSVDGPEDELHHWVMRLKIMCLDVKSVQVDDFYCILYFCKYFANRMNLNTCDLRSFVVGLSW